MPDYKDVIRFDAIGDFDDVDQIVGVYHATLETEIGITNAQCLGDLKSLFSDLWDIIGNLHSILVTMRRIRAYNVTTAQLIGESAFGTPLLGTLTGDPCPTQVTAPLTFKTLYPRVMLRKLWGPPAESVVESDGRFGTTVATRLAQAAVFLLDTMVAGGREYQYGYPSPIAGVFVVPTVAVYSNIPGTLRRRRIGVGS